MDITKLTRTELESYCRFLQRQVKEKTETVAGWHDRMGGSFSDQEIIDDLRRKQGWY